MQQILNKNQVLQLLVQCSGVFQCRRLAYTQIMQIGPNFASNGLADDIQWNRKSQQNYYSSICSQIQHFSITQGRLSGSTMQQHSAAKPQTNSQVTAPVITTSKRFYGLLDDAQDDDAIEEAQKLQQDEFYVRRVKQSDVVIAYCKATGAGGQGVNRGLSIPTLRLDIAKASFLGPQVKEQLLQHNKTTKDGVLEISASGHRDMLDNLRVALDKLQKVLDTAAAAVRPKVTEDDYEGNMTARVVTSLRNKRIKDSKRNKKHSVKSAFSGQ